MLPAREPEVVAHSLRTMGSGRGRRGWARVFALVDEGTVRFVRGADGATLAAAPLERSRPAPRFPSSIP